MYVMASNASASDRMLIYTQFASANDWTHFASISQAIGGSYTTTPSVISSQMNGGATTKLTVEGGFSGSKIASAGANNFEALALFMPWVDTPSQYVGWIGEFIVFDRALTDDEITAVQQYLTRWL